MIKLQLGNSMLKNIIVVTACLFTISFDTAMSVAAPAPLPEPQKSVLKGSYSKEQVISLIEEIAQEKAVSADILKTVINCESGYKTNAIGDNGHSRGLVQIYDDYHPNISHEQAFDPVFAINFLADNINAGKGHLWTCYRNNY